MNNLQEKFINEIRPSLMKEFGYSNILEVTSVEKVVINIGLTQKNINKELIKNIQADLKSIAGQYPVITKAKKSIAGFKIRQGQDVGIKVTLRGKKMWDFIYRLVSASLPRIKDFQGLEIKNIDQNGNLNIGIREHLIFPEISTDDVRIIFGFQVSISSKGHNVAENIKMFRLLGFPIKKD
jgi:large subunit ribosomal protein L5